MSNKYFVQQYDLRSPNLRPKKKKRKRKIGLPYLTKPDQGRSKKSRLGRSHAYHLSSDDEEDTEPKCKFDSVEPRRKTEQIPATFSKTESTAKIKKQLEKREKNQLAPFKQERNKLFQIVEQQLPSSQREDEEIKGKTFQKEPSLKFMGMKERRTHYTPLREGLQADPEPSSEKRQMGFTKKSLNFNIEIDLLLRQTRQQKFKRMNEDEEFQPVSKGIVLKDEIRYETLRELNEGQFASVYLARDVKTGKKVVLKTYYKYKVLQTRRKNFVNREISLLKKLRHPNIITLNSTYSTKFGIHLVLEFMPQNLYELVRSRPLAQSEAILLFRQLLSAVHYCHSLNIVHRDIKLQNILVDSALLLKLTDFGYSSYDSDAHDLYVGTLLYIAPEILLKKKYAGKPVDVWALGVVLHILLHGKPPFAGSDQASLLQCIKDTHKAVASKCHHVVATMLSLEPRSRPTSSELMNCF